MSLTEQDNQRLIELFAEKAKQEKESDTYYKYRDLIFTEVLSKLADYFKILKYDWNTKFKIPEEDGISIIHDGLLASVNTFDYQYRYYKNHELGVTKFITYLTHNVNNLARNYWYKNHVTEKRSKTKFHRMPSSMYVSLDTLLERIDNTDYNEPMPRGFPDLMKYLSDKYSYFDDSFNMQFFLEQFLKKLPEKNQYLLKSIIDGYNFAEIGRQLKLSPPAVKLRLKRLVKKFKVIEKELCQYEKI